MNTIALISTGTTEDISTVDASTVKDLSAKGTHVADMTTTEVNIVDGTVIVTAGGKK
jgi:phosphoribosylformylglycinamidine (FGAM) synthase-like amidotransferase family enzyme